MEFDLNRRKGRKQRFEGDLEIEFISASSATSG
jgi:hypothetical protein